MPAAEEPITDGELEPLFAYLGAAGAIALAVSGGADSLALMALVERWRRLRGCGPEIHVFTVDHGLRAGASAEAGAVASVATGMGLRHRILEWRGRKPTTGIEEAAREARYGLLSEAAMNAGILHLLTAHHREDQAETVLMRLGRSSGLKGLSGMRRQRPLANGVTLSRPLLDLPKSRLARTVESLGFEAAIDDSNFDQRFARPRLRVLMPGLANAGIAAESVAKTARRLQRADEAIEFAVNAFVEEFVSVDAHAVIAIQRDRFRSAPAEIRVRTLERILAASGGVDWPPPRSERVEAVENAIMAAEPFKRTLAGSVISAEREAVVFHRETGRRPLDRIAVSAGDWGIWDGRFSFRIDICPDRLSLGPLGDAGRVTIEARIEGVPRQAMVALPTFRIDDEIVAVPTLGFESETAPSMKVRLDCMLSERMQRRPEAWF